MHRSPFIALVLLCGSAFGQAVDSARPKVTPELAKRIQAGVGRMAEAEAVGLLPAPYRMESGGPKADWRITCPETTEIQAEFVDGKLSSRSAGFDPSVESKNLTRERFRSLKDGMSLNEVATRLGNTNRRRRRCRQGRPRSSGGDLALGARSRVMDHRHRWDRNRLRAHRVHRELNEAEPGVAPDRRGRVDSRDALLTQAAAGR